MWRNSTDFVGCALSDQGQANNWLLESIRMRKEVVYWIPPSLEPQNGVPIILREPLRRLSVIRGSFICGHHPAPDRVIPTSATVDTCAASPSRTREPRWTMILGEKKLGASRADDVTVPSQTRSLAEARQIAGPDHSTGRFCSRD